MPDARTSPSDPAPPRSAAVDYSSDGVTFVCRFTGDWLLKHDLPDVGSIAAELGRDSSVRELRYDTTELGDWDSGLLTALIQLGRAASDVNITTDPAGLPEGAQGLLKLAFAVAERAGARRTLRQPGVAESTGLATLEAWTTLHELLGFTGEIVLSLRRFLGRRATVRGSDIWLAIQEAGAEALPIVGLISFLIGMIFAFVGVVQLTDFGAGIYTADLVAVALVREMAPIMTAIIMAGRTGAAYAAQLGTMKVNEEIDALTTLGVNPIDYLVLPRFFALLLMMPFLTMYASLLGILGGTAVAVNMLDVSLLQYWVQTSNSVDMSTLFGGLFKAIVYGAMVALTGTQQGMACGSSAMAVGVSTTRAVVLGIVLIVVSAALLTVIYINLGI